ncbi:MAG: hypothetical protein NUV77_21235, partial [Thermoguttaceae bacterium]|nr:hypothetical protein [Thermoguttaceae bacterium]
PAADALLGGGISGFMEQVPANQDPQVYLQNKALSHQMSQMEAFFTGLRLPRAGYPKLRDADGQLGLGCDEYHLVQLFSLPADAPPGTEQAASPAEPLAGLDPDDEPMRGVSPFGGIGREEEQAAVVDEAYEKTARDYVARAAISVIAADDATVLERVRWFPAGKRPAFGLRFGVGVHYAGQGTVPKIRNPHELEQITGPIGTVVGQTLHTHLVAGNFGRWTAGGDPRLRQVAFLGAAAGLDDLLSAARRQALDVLAVLAVQPRAGAAARRAENSVRLRFVDVASGKGLWASEAVMAGSPLFRKGGAAVEQAIAAAVKRIDTDLCLADMPELTAEQVKARLAALGLPGAKPADPLAALVELRYYQAAKLLSADEVTELYDAVLGAGKGRTLATGDRAARRALLQEVFLQSETSKGR